MISGWSLGERASCTCRRCETRHWFIVNAIVPRRFLIDCENNRHPIEECEHAD